MEGIIQVINSMGNSVIGILLLIVSFAVILFLLFLPHIYCDKRTYGVYSFGKVGIFLNWLLMGVYFKWGLKGNINIDSIKSIIIVYIMINLFFIFITEIIRFHEYTNSPQSIVLKENVEYGAKYGEYLYKIKETNKDYILVEYYKKRYEKGEKFLDLEKEEKIYIDNKNKTITLPFKLSYCEKCEFFNCHIRGIKFNFDSNSKLFTETWQIQNSSDKLVLKPNINYAFINGDA